MLRVTCLLITKIIWSLVITLDLMDTELCGLLITEFFFPFHVQQEYTLCACVAALASDIGLCSETFTKLAWDSVDAFIVKS